MALFDHILHIRKMPNCLFDFVHALCEILFCDCVRIVVIVAFEYTDFWRIWAGCVFSNYNYLVFSYEFYLSFSFCPWNRSAFDSNLASWTASSCALLSFWDCWALFSQKIFDEMLPFNLVMLKLFQPLGLGFPLF